MLDVLFELLGVPLEIYMYGKLLDEEDSMGYIRGCVVSWVYVIVCMVGYRSAWKRDDQE